MRLGNEVVAAFGVRHHRNQIGHGSARHVERGFLPEQRGRERLQTVDRRVLAVRVVADLRGGHCRAHRFRRPGDGVAAQVDDVVHGAVFATGRMSPSWITVIARWPSRV